MEELNKISLTDRIKRSSRRLTTTLAAIALAGCAGYQRDCQSCCAGMEGADWIVLQYDYSGTPINCWKLPDTSVSNESATDGIYWVDGPSGNLVHISGWYNRVQIENENWEEAAQSIDIDLGRCTNGKYLPPALPEE